MTTLNITEDVACLEIHLALHLQIIFRHLFNYLNMADEQHMAAQEVAMPSIANAASSIVKSWITGHFELIQTMIQLLHANGQFVGLPHEDPQQHILNFFEISDTYITNGVTPDYVRLTLFMFSLLG